MAEARTDELKAQNHAACLSGASVINTVIATHNKGSDATSDDFVFEMTHDEKKARVSRSMGYLVDMMARDDWGSEDMTAINAAIAAGTTFVG
tara:strand:- start:1354 stop:1629 length:276 start_codon:yes stop_codon:yes gene_type:complete